MTQTIELYVSPTVEIRIETHGFTGVACQTASQFLEAALGQRQREILTNEFYDLATVLPAKQEVRP